MSSSVPATRRRRTLAFASLLLLTVEAVAQGPSPLAPPPAPPGNPLTEAKARLAAEKAEASGVEVRLEIWDEMWHVWHAWAEELPEARAAIARIGVFVRQHLD